MIAYKEYRRAADAHETSYRGRRIKKPNGPAVAVVGSVCADGTHRRLVQCCWAPADGTLRAELPANV